MHSLPFLITLQHSLKESWKLWYHCLKLLELVGYCFMFSMPDITPRSLLPCITLSLGKTTPVCWRPVRAWSIERGLLTSMQCGVCAQGKNGVRSEFGLHLSCLNTSGLSDFSIFKIPPHSESPGWLGLAYFVGVNQLIQG